MSDHAGYEGVIARGVCKRFRLHENRPRSFGEAIYRLARRTRPPAPGSGDGRYLWALKDVSLSVRPGHGLGLVGHNGSGKSTMLKLIAGILRPTSGSLNVRGRLSPLIELAAGFHPDFTGRENVFLNGLILGLSRSYVQRRLPDILEFSGIAPFIDVPVKYYSSGMYMRLAFSVATQVQPDILLVDEVLAVGDEGFQRKCLSRIAEMKASGTGLLLVSHSRGLVAAVCEDVVWLDHGSIRFTGSVADFMGMPDEVGTDAPPRLDLEVRGSSGELVCLGRSAGPDLAVGLTLAAGNMEGWRVGLSVYPFGTFGSDEMRGAGIPLDGGRRQAWFRVTGLSPEAVYSLRGWAVRKGETIWSGDVTFGVQPANGADVRWEPWRGPK